MAGNRPISPPPLPQNDRTGLRRIAAAVAISTLLHIFIALLMRPTYRPVNDFAVDFEVVNVTSAPPKPARPEPEPAATPETAPETPKPKPKQRPKSTAPALPETPPIEPSTDETAVADSEGDTDTDTEPEGGICMHDLFAYAAEKPNWILYVAAAAFRDSVYEKELADTFSSFELGRRLAKMTGMNLTRDVESLFVGASDIFDWKSFQIAVSYDFGEEALKARIKEQQKNLPDFAWQKTDDGFTAALPGQFRWDLLSSGRVMSITHAPETEPVPPPIPENPFATSPDTDTSAIPSAETDTAAPAEGKSTAENPAQTEPVFPKQVACISAKAATASKKKLRTKDAALTDSAKQLMTPDAKGHWPVAVLSTSDPRAVGLGTRLGRKMGFETAAVRGYFTEPVRLEGYLQFSKEPSVVEALAADWRKDAERFAQDPFLAIAGVASLLKNLQITVEGSTLRFSLEMNHGQVLSTLLFLQLQGKALERQLKSD